VYADGTIVSNDNGKALHDSPTSTSKPVGYRNAPAAAEADASQQRDVARRARSGTTFFFLDI